MVNNGSKQVCCVGYVIVPERDIKVLVGARAIINLCAWIFILSGNYLD